MTPLDHVINMLQTTTLPLHTANPYADFIPGLDIGPDAPVIRTRQLREYLESRLEQARYVLVAEAKGYQGGRFTGVPLTSERMLLGRQPGFDQALVLPSGQAERTSEVSLKPHGFAEPTATIVWKALQDFGLQSSEVVLWNIYPFHPYHSKKGPLSNRTPTAAELEIGGKIFAEFLALFPNRKVIAAIGRKSQEMLNKMNFANTPLRHPANGGAKQFRAQLQQLFVDQSAASCLKGMHHQQAKKHTFLST